MYILLVSFFFFFTMHDPIMSAAMPRNWCLLLTTNTLVAHSRCSVKVNRMSFIDSAYWTVALRRDVRIM